jgi:DNA-directed RNA polymerase specialized sigma24 family protein
MTQKQLKEFIEDPKAYMSQGQYGRRLIESKRERIRNWRRLIESVTIPMKEKTGAAKFGQKDRLLENVVGEIDELEREILAEIAELIATERIVKAAIDLLARSEKHKSILELRYLHGYNWREVAGKLHYGEDWICRQHGAALAAMKRHAVELTV